MRQLRRIKFTKEGLEDLKKQVAQLENSRPAAVKELSRAREMGDLSENGLYTAAKQRLRSIDSQLRRLSLQTKLADVVDSQRFVVEQNGKQVTYEIVGDFEANPAEHKLSANSPIGKALLASHGDTAEINTPGGKIVVKILNRP